MKIWPFYLFLTRALPDANLMVLMQNAISLIKHKTFSRQSSHRNLTGEAATAQWDPAVSSFFSFQGVLRIDLQLGLFHVEEGEGGK